MSTSTPAIAGWFTDGESPTLIASRCTRCGNLAFPPPPPEATSFCRNPSCDGEEHQPQPLSRTGRVWSYTDAQYQPPAPFIAPTDPFEPFALAAVELPEGLVVLGQVASGYGVTDLAVGTDVELVVETLYEDESGTHTIWRWKPVVELGEETDQ